MANYHTIQYAQKYWMPIFDDYKFVGIFENHVHHYKRTYPLTNNQINSQYGVTYFGDGCWGIFLETCDHGTSMVDMNIFADYAISEDQHVWVLQMNETSATYFAFRPNNTLMSPPYTQPLINYKLDF